MADCISGVFVPIVIGLAAITFGVWWHLPDAPQLHMALRATVSVLIIACPCGLGLATPSSIMVGTGRAAERGVLFRDGGALERMKSVTAIVLDKTGTITEWTSSRASVVCAAGTEDGDVLRLAAGAERMSAHPIARAIVAGAIVAGAVVAGADARSADVAEDCDGLGGECCDSCVGRDAGAEWSGGGCRGDRCVAGDGADDSRETVLGVWVQRGCDSGRRACCIR